MTKLTQIADYLKNNDARYYDGKRLKTVECYLVAAKIVKKLKATKHE